MPRSLPLATLVLTGLLSLGPAFADDEHNTFSGLTTSGASLGLHGMDPVAFIETGSRVDGSVAHRAVHDEVTYYFSSEANRVHFKLNPGRYVRALPGDRQRNRGARQQ